MTTKNQTKVCVHCKKEFTIEPEDFSFYEKIKVPPPTWCVDCRQQRRYAWRNERTLYRRNCDLCGKNTVTIYSPNKPYKVYCNSCWWSDDWDPAFYGRDYDFSRSFFEQFKELQKEVPRMALLNKNSVNSEYTNHSSDNKNVYLSFICFYDENVMYGNWVLKSRECADCSYIEERGEKLYECVDSRSSYKCQYGNFLRECSDCYYCYDCRGCNNCFMSSNLRNKSYVFQNKQYSREEYFKKLKEYDLSSFLNREGLLKEYEDMLKNSTLYKGVNNERNVDSNGSMIFDSKNVKSSFEIDKCENMKYSYAVLEMKDSMDTYHAGYNSELCYEIHGCARVSNCMVCHLSYDDVNVSYSDTCQNSQNLFGCVSVKKGEYMILNKKYSKEDYENLKSKIIEQMTKTGEYGEFFPIELAPVYYNETQGAIYMPMTKEEVLAKGWNWEDGVPGTFGRETILAKNIPDSINDTPETIVSEIFACMDCKRNYNITINELLFYKKEGIPLPRRCPNCRYKRRFLLRLPRKLWNRSCMCNKSNHQNHMSNTRCLTKFETPHDPSKPGLVYCEKCYQQEVY